MIGAELLQQHQRFGLAVVGDDDAVARRVLAHEKFVGAALAKSEHNGRFDAEWTESSRERHEADEKNAYPYSFLTLDRAG